MKRFLLCALIGVAFWSCERDGNGDNEVLDWRVDYSPGQHWHYEKSMNGEKTTDVFVNSFEENDTILLAAVIKSPWGEWETIAKYEDREDGLYRVDHGSYVIDGALRSMVPVVTETKVMSYPIEIGKSWVLNQVRDYVWMKEYVKDTTIVTDDGNYQCVRVDVSLNGELDYSEYVSKKGIILMKRKTVLEFVNSDPSIMGDIALWETKLNFHQD